MEVNDPVLRRALEQKLRSLAASGVTHVPRAPNAAATPPDAVASSPARQWRVDSPRLHLAGPHASGANVVAESSPKPWSVLHESPEPDVSRRSIPLASPDLPEESTPSEMERPVYGASRGKLSRSRELEVLAEEVRGCTLCAELARTRKQTVFGVGNPNSPVVFFGEAPGADEDRLGEPFVGRAGQLLTKIIQACGWQREDIYIMNVLKCRPPGNRTPTPHEAQLCRPFFERQLEIIAPQYIVCLGAVAATTLLETSELIGRLRGRWHRWRDAKVVVTYHPAYLLRNPSAKRFTWDDMKMLLHDMGREPGGGM